MNLDNLRIEVVESAPPKPKRLTNTQHLSEWEKRHKHGVSSKKKKPRPSTKYTEYVEVTSGLASERQRWTGGLITQADGRTYVPITRST
jgi:hypothetical protein